jgi:hypothetical protein
MKLLDNAQNFQSALNHFDDLVEASESDQDAEKRASLADGVCLRSSLQRFD